MTVEKGNREGENTFGCTEECETSLWSQSRCVWLSLGFLCSIFSSSLGGVPLEEDRKYSMWIGTTAFSSVMSVVPTSAITGTLTNVNPQHFINGCCHHLARCSSHFVFIGPVNFIFHNTISPVDGIPSMFGPRPLPYSPKALRCSFHFVS